MLEVDPEQRIRLDEIEEHPFFICIWKHLYQSQRIKPNSSIEQLKYNPIIVTALHFSKLSAFIFKWFFFLNHFIYS